MFTNHLIRWQSSDKTLERMDSGYCQTPLQLANPTQLQLVGEGVDFVFPRKKEEGRKEEEVTPT